MGKIPDASAKSALRQLHASHMREVLPRDIWLLSLMLGEGYLHTGWAPLAILCTILLRRTIAKRCVCEGKHAQGKA